MRVPDYNQDVGIILVFQSFLLFVIRVDECECLYELWSADALQFVVGNKDF